MYPSESSEPHIQSSWCTYVHDWSVRSQFQPYFRIQISCQKSSATLPSPQASKKILTIWSVKLWSYWLADSRSVASSTKCSPNFAKFLPEYFDGWRTLIRFLISSMTSIDINWIDCRINIHTITNVSSSWVFFLIKAPSSFESES